MTEPKALTKKELRRLAKEARVLAMECVEGTAPAFGPWFTASGISQWPCCPIGEVARRAKMSPEAISQDAGPSDYNGGWWAERLVSEANGIGLNRWMEFRSAMPLRAVFPLLALADALEDASKTPKSIP